MSDKTGGAAFPLSTEYGEKVESSEGMTLRDYFAAKAMAAMIGTSAEPWGRGCEDYVATNAYTMAEAMLTEREKRND